MNNKSLKDRLSGKNWQAGNDASHTNLRVFGNPVAQDVEHSVGGGPADEELFIVRFLWVGKSWMRDSRRILLEPYHDWTKTRWEICFSGEGSCLTPSVSSNLAGCCVQLRRWRWRRRTRGTRHSGSSRETDLWGHNERKALLNNLTQRSISSCNNTYFKDLH